MAAAFCFYMSALPANECGHQNNPSAETAAMVENGWKLHLDDDLDFVSKSDELLVLLLGDNLGDAMLWLAAYAAAVGVAVVTLARSLL
jgi:hypothetical protein